MVVVGDEEARGLSLLGQATSGAVTGLLTFAEGAGWTCGSAGTGAGAGAGACSG